MTKEQYKSIEKYRNQFDSAIKTRFSRMSEGEFGDICKMYKELFGIEVSKSQKNCGSCRLKIVQSVGREFFNYEVWYVNKYHKSLNENSCNSNPGAQNAVEGHK